MVLRHRRGVILIVATLAISIVLFTTQIYIYSLSRSETKGSYSALTDYIMGIELGSNHAVIASLVNVSQGGSTSHLVDNLDRWESFVSSDYQYGRCALNATVAMQLPYSKGIWIDWGTEGTGVSSAYADFSMVVSGRGIEVDWRFTKNVTTTVLVSGSRESVPVNLTRVTVFVNLLNEGAPSLADSITLSYRDGGWLDPTALGSYSQQDYGNGTYRYTFEDNISEPTIDVRVEAYDRRGVFVQAETRAQ